jgi:hypothetical protein
MVLVLVLVLVLLLVLLYCHDQLDDDLHLIHFELPASKMPKESFEEVQANVGGRTLLELP